MSVDVKGINAAVKSTEEGNREGERKPYVSIIIAVYNIEEHIERCVRSILRQTLRNIEIIVIDDGSEDDSGKICDSLAEADRRVKVIHTSNEGLPSVRQRGVRMASAEWIGFVDGDDWIESSMYETLYQKAVMMHADVVVQGYVEEAGSKNTYCLNNMKCGVYDVNDFKWNFFYKMICCDDFFRMGIQPYMWNKLFKKDLLWSHLQNMDLRIRIGEDAAVVFPVLMKANRIVVTSDCCYHYCLRGNSMMHRGGEEQQEYDNALRLHNFLKKSFIRYGRYEAVRNALDRYTIHNLLTRAVGCIVRDIDVPPDKEIILYGAGAFGKSLYGYLMSQDRYHVRLWIDKKAEQLAQMGFPVSGPEKMHTEKTDVVLIALLNERAAAEVRNELRQAGLKTEQLVWAMDVLRLAELEL